MHIACGDITDVSFNDNKFCINVVDEFLFDLINQEENLKDLKQAFNSFNITNFEVVKKDKVLTKSQQDIARLKEVFGNKLIIE